MCEDYVETCVRQCLDKYWIIVSQFYIVVVFLLCYAHSYARVVVYGIYQALHNDPRKCYSYVYVLM